MKRKLFSAVLALVMLLAVMPAASATSSGVVDYLNIDFDDATNTARLTPETVATVMTGATLNEKNSVYTNNTTTVLAQLVSDSSDVNRGNFLKLYNNSGTNSAVSITIPFTSTYIPGNGDVLVWEMDYKVSSEGVHYGFVNVLDSNEENSIYMQKMGNPKYYLRDSRGADGTIAKNIIPANDVWTHQKIVMDVKGGKILSAAYTNTSGTTEFVNNADATFLDDAAYLQLIFSLTSSAAATAQEYYVDNIHIYSLPKMSIASSTVDGKETVLVDSDVTVNFTNAIEDTSALITSVSAGGQTVDANDYTVTPSQDKKSVTISFAGNMEYGTDYVITFSGAVDGNGLAINDSVTFATEAAPDITVEDVSLYKSNGAGFTMPALLVADGCLQNVALSLQNNTIEAKNALLMFAVYNASNRLVDVSYVSTLLAGNESASVIQGLEIPASASGGYVKMFVWNQLTALNPYVSPVTLTIQ